jgi:hypothetical protein
MLSAAFLFAAGACGSTAPEGKGGPGAAASVPEVRALVQQFGEGGGDKDEAGEALYNLGDRARPALLEIVRDPATPLHELDSIIFITSLYVNSSPELIAALRTRAAAIPDAEERIVRLGLIDGMESGELTPPNAP